MPNVLHHETAASSTYIHASPSLLRSTVRSGILGIVLALPLVAGHKHEANVANIHQKDTATDPKHLLETSFPSLAEVCAGDNLLSQTFLVMSDVPGELPLKVTFDRDLGIRINGTLYRGDEIADGSVWYRRADFEQTTGIPKLTTVSRASDVQLISHDTRIRVSERDILTLVRHLHRAPVQETQILSPEILCTIDSEQWAVKAALLCKKQPSACRIRFTRFPVPERQHFVSAQKP